MDLAPAHEPKCRNARVCGRTCGPRTLQTSTLVPDSVWLRSHILVISTDMDTRHIGILAVISFHKTLAMVSHQ